MYDSSLIQLETIQLGECVRVKINDQHRLLEEHFPGNPVLPGSIALSIALAEGALLLAKQSSCSHRIKELRKITFLKKIQPGIEYILKYKSDLCPPSMIIFTFFFREEKNLAECIRGQVLYERSI